MTFSGDIIDMRRKLITKLKENDFISSVEISEKLMSLHNKSTDQKNIGYAEDLYNVAFTYHSLNLFEKAMEFYYKSLNITKTFTNEPTDYINILNNIAICCTKLKNYDGAVELFEELIKIIGTNSDYDSPFYFDILYNYANTNFDIGNYNECILKHKLILEKKIDISPVEFIDSYNSIGYAFEKLNDFKNAVKYFKVSLSIIKDLYTSESQEYISNIYYLATVYFKYSKFNQSAKLYREVANKIKKIYSEKHPYYADVLNKYAEALYSNKQNELSLEIRLKALKIVKEQMGENHLYYANSLRNLAMLYKNENQIDKTIELLNESITIKHKILGASNSDYLKDILLLNSIYLQQNDLESSIFSLGKTLKLLKEENFENIEIYKSINKIYNNIKNLFKFEAHNNKEDTTQPIETHDVYELLSLAEKITLDNKHYFDI